MTTTTNGMARIPPDSPVTERVEFPDNRLVLRLCGALNEHLKLVEKHLHVLLHPLGNGVTITAPAPQAARVKQLLTTLYADLERGLEVDAQRVTDGIRSLENDGASVASLTAPPGDGLLLRTPRRIIQPRTHRQADYLRAMTVADLTFAIGPAGTGKTYLAVAMAVVSLLAGEVARIILTRPAVEAGERLGFLPGDLQAKIDPYLRPLYDALYDMLGTEKVERMLGRQELEIAPLAYMRGRTLEGAFIILDEAQNATTEQMKMFLTRFGVGSKVAVSGDITQQDLPRGQLSGLVQAMDILQNLSEVAFIHFTHRDVVRHPLVRKIVWAYEQAHANKPTHSPDTPGKT